MANENTGVSSLIPDFGLQTASNLLQTGVNALLQRNASRRAFNQQKQLMQLSDQYQRNLMQDTPLINKSAMQDAGLSTAALNDPFNGASTNATGSAPPPAAAQMTPIDVSSLRTASMQRGVLEGQKELLSAQTHKAEAEANAQELLNKQNKRDYDDEEAQGKERYRQWYANLSDSDKSLADAQRPDYKPGENGLDEVTIKSPIYISQKRWELLTGNVKNRMDAEYSEYTQRHTAAVFDAAIKGEQLHNDDIKAAIVGLPKVQFDKLKQELDNLQQSYNITESIKQYTIDTAKWNSKKAEQDFLNSKNDKELKDIAINFQKIINPLIENYQRLQNDALSKENDFKSKTYPSLIKRVNAGNKNDSDVLLNDILSGKASFTDVIKFGLPIIGKLFEAVGPALVKAAFK